MTADLLAAIAGTVGRQGLPFRLAGAHDALTARLAEAAGFDGIWAGSLEQSASQFVADTGTLGLGRTVERVAGMAGAVRCPVLVDAEIGYDDPAQTVADFEQAGAAGIVIEDQAAPKSNSLRPNGLRLRDQAEFCRLMEKAVAAKGDADFVVAARIESLVAGEPVTVAVERARAYADAGADALIIHSRSTDGVDVGAALDLLHTDLPVGVIPTTYYRRTAGELAAAGASFVIYANHGLRAQMRAVRSIYDDILRTGSTASIEDRIATIVEVLDFLPTDPPD